MRFASLALALLSMVVTGCGQAPAPDASDDASAAAAGLDEDSIIEFLNGPDASFTTLTVDVRLQQRTAGAIVRHVRGADRTLGTHDDNLLQDLAELDAIKYVGPATLAALEAYVRSHAQPHDVSVEGVDLSADAAAQILALANNAPFALLDDDVGLDSRAAHAIVAARPIANVEALAAVSYVGTTALIKLRDYALTHPTAPTPTTLTPEVPVPYVLQWINDYVGQGYVSRLNLHRDGTYDATVNGAPEHGVFFGPGEGDFQSPIALRLSSPNGVAWTANLTLYTGQSAEVSRDGHPSSLPATLPTDGEDACGEGGGTYLDDDANSAGLYCECPDNQSWIPSQGGCID